MVLFVNFINAKEVIGKVPIKINIIMPWYFFFVLLRISSLLFFRLNFVLLGILSAENISISFQRHALGSFYLNKNKTQKMVFSSFFRLGYLPFRINSDSVSDWLDGFALLFFEFVVVFYSLLS